MSVQYWPEKIGMEVSFGQINVLLESENTLNDYIHRQMKITYATVSIMLLFIVLIHSAMLLFILQLLFIVLLLVLCYYL